jgi:hypothetical protein
MVEFAGLILAPLHSSKKMLATIAPNNHGLGVIWHTVTEIEIYNEQSCAHNNSFRNWGWELLCKINSKICIRMQHVLESPSHDVPITCICNRGFQSVQYQLVFEFLLELLWVQKLGSGNTTEVLLYTYDEFLVLKMLILNFLPTFIDQFICFYSKTSRGESTKVQHVKKRKSLACGNMSEYSDNPLG